MKMVLGFATRKWSGYRDCIASWKPHPCEVVIVEDMDVLEAYQTIYHITDAPIIGVPHDDVMCYEEGWWERVLREFSDPGVGLVGFAGARRHGRPDIYVAPYDLPQLGRFGFMSNLRTAERHGTRFTGECDVAVLDGLAMFVRRSILEKCGGWPLDTPIAYFCYDYWLSCEVRRQGYRIRLVGVDVDHLGGKSSGFINPDPGKSHAESHKWLYEHSRDVLPFEVSHD